MHKTILVPIDLSDSEKSKPMIKMARQMGGKDARIILVNVVEEIPAYVASQVPYGILKKSGENAGEELKALASAAGIKPDIEVRSGAAHNAILDVAQELEADLIIVGSHKPGLQDYLLGSTASRIVRHAICSVLVMR
jgi:nucleotide-binding universal stress UspA family protein